MKYAVILALLALLPFPALAQNQQQAPYSCRLLYDEERKCAYDPHCDKRVVERLRKECLRDGGRP